MRDCDTLRETILESVGAEPPTGAAAAHLAGCAACRREVRAALRALALLDLLPAATVPAGFAPRVVARAKAEARGARATWIAAAAAALLVVTIGLVAVAGRGGTGGSGPEVAQGDGGAGTVPAEPPPELLEQWELLENLELLQRLDVLEALDAVEAREQFAALDG
jgi:predicted anti-sigma-YlaC factor YlaD